MRQEEIKKTLALIEQMVKEVRAEIYPEENNYGLDDQEI